MVCRSDTLVRRLWPWVRLVAHLLASRYGNLKVPQPEIDFNGVGQECPTHTCGLWGVLREREARACTDTRLDRLGETEF